jgi:RNA polymerase sigma-32 factor
MTLSRHNGRDGLARSIRESQAFPLLTPEVERELCRRWRDRFDRAAAQRLVGSYLRLVMKVARGYRGYGLPQEDLISEGQLGLMRALCRFDPDRGVRLSTYATWWIQAAIREYVLQNWSLVKIGTTATRKKLFFNLRRACRDLRIPGHSALAPEHVSRISKLLHVPESEVLSMSERMAGPDVSLNTPISVEDGGEWEAYLADENDGQEALVAESEEKARRKSLLNYALGQLTTRERQIVAARHLGESSMTLSDLSRQHGVSRERVRQIEARAVEKLQNSVRQSITSNM